MDSQKMFSIVRGVTLFISPIRRLSQNTRQEHKLRDVVCDLTGYDYLDNKFRFGLGEPRGLAHGYGPYVGTYLAEGIIGLVKTVAKSLE